MQEGEREIRITLRLGRAVDRDASVLASLEQLTRDPHLLGTVLPQIFLRHLQLDSSLLTALQCQDLTATAAALGQAVADKVEHSGQPLSAAACHQWLLVELAVQAANAASFFACLGRFFSRWLLDERDGPDALQLQTITQAAHRWLSDRDASVAGLGDPSSLLLGAQLPEHAVVFDQLCSGLFALQLSGEAGWHAATNTCVVRPQPVSAGASGLQFVVRLRPEDPAIIGCNAELHGAQWPMGLPLVRLELRTQAWLYPYSLFDDVLLSEVDLEVSVCGARRLVFITGSSKRAIDYTVIVRMGKEQQSGPPRPIQAVQSFRAAAVAWLLSGDGLRGSGSQAPARAAMAHRVGRFAHRAGGLR